MLICFGSIWSYLLWSAVLLQCIQDWPGATQITPTPHQPWFCPPASSFSLAQVIGPRSMWSQVQCPSFQSGKLHPRSGLPIIEMFSGSFNLISKTPKPSCFAQLSCSASPLCLPALSSWHLSSIGQGLAVHLLGEENKASNSQQEKWKQLVARLSLFQIMLEGAANKKAALRYFDCLSVTADSPNSSRVSVAQQLLSFHLHLPQLTANNQDCEGIWKENAMGRWTWMQDN